MQPSERINKSVVWFRENRATIEKALPLDTPGITFLPGWCDGIEKTIEKHDKGNISPALATAYIFNPLAAIARAVNTTTET